MDVVKCNMQIDPIKYKGIGASFGTIIREQGLLSGLYKGWSPTLIGYSAQVRTKATRSISLGFRVRV